MQKRIWTGVAAVTGSVMLATSALALPSIAMIWRTNGTATIGTPSVSTSSVVISDVVLTGDATNFVIGVFVSFEFDTNELQVIRATELTSVKWRRA